MKQYKIPLSCAHKIVSLLRARLSNEPPAFAKSLSSALLPLSSLIPRSIYDSALDRYSENTFITAVNHKDVVAALKVVREELLRLGARERQLGISGFEDKESYLRTVSTSERERTIGCKQKRSRFLLRHYLSKFRARNPLLTSRLSPLATVLSYRWSEWGEQQQSLERIDAETAKRNG